LKELLEIIYLLLLF